MKTAVISDIHVDINEEYPVVEALAEELNKRDVQLLLLAGDISDCADQKYSDSGKAGTGKRCPGALCAGKP